MQAIHTHLTAAGHTVYLTGLEHAAEAGALLARLHADPVALLVGEVHAALTAQDAGAVLLHVELLEPPQQSSRFGADGLSGFLLSFPLGLKLYDSDGGRWLLDVTLVLTASDYAGGEDFALQTDFMVNTAAQLQDK